MKRLRVMRASYYLPRHENRKFVMRTQRSLRNRNLREENGNASDFCFISSWKSGDRRTRVNGRNADIVLAAEAGSKQEERRLIASGASKEQRDDTVT